MERVSVIPSSDGRLIEVTEGSLRAPPPPPVEPKKKRKRYKRYQATGTKRASKGRARYDSRGSKHVVSQCIKAIPGYKAWLSERQLQLALERRASYPGNVPGIRYAEALRRWAISRERAKEDMTKLKGKLNLSDSAEEALTEVLTVMRGPQAPALKLQAAKVVLEWTMTKPVAKQEVTLNTAEKWLESLIADEPEG